MQIEISSNHQLQGYLLVDNASSSSSSDQEFFTPEDKRVILEYVATALSLWFHQELIIQETELRLQGDVVWSLINGEGDSWEAILSRAKTLGYELHLPYVCILGYPENLHELYEKQSASNLPYEQWRLSLIYHMEELVLQAGNSIQRHTMVTFQHDYLSIFLEVPLKELDVTVHVFLDHFERRLSHMLPDLVMSWGIGEHHAGVRNFRESYEDARIALNIGQRQKGPGQRSTYTSTGIYRVLLSLAHHQEIREITWSTIAPLIDYDYQKGMDLDKTLVAYIRNQGNVSQTARTLNLHRQSLLYRMRKIESLTGRSLMDPDDLFLLDLSMKMWMMGMMEIPHHQESVR